MIDIQQSEFAITASAPGIDPVLSTTNLLFCTALFGFNSSSGLAFLAHFDSPSSTSGMDEISDHLLALGSSADSIETYLVNGSKAPFYTSWVRENLIDKVSMLPPFKGVPQDIGRPFAHLRTRLVINAADQTWVADNYTISFRERLKRPKFQRNYSMRRVGPSNSELQSAMGSLAKR